MVSNCSLFERINASMYSGQNLRVVCLSFETNRYKKDHFKRKLYFGTKYEFYKLELTLFREILILIIIIKSIEDSKR